jgi:spore maturation protein B
MTTDRRGLKVIYRFFPPSPQCCRLFICSDLGRLDAFPSLLTPVFNFWKSLLKHHLILIGVSGSGALAVATGSSSKRRDSIIGKKKRRYIGSTETTFYTVAVYLGAAGL